MRNRLWNSHTHDEPFKNADQLATNVAADIHNWLNALKNAAPQSEVPRQLPPPPRDFTGRADDIEELVNGVKRGGVTISGVHGMGGIGKTALAHALAPDFPDGQIFLDLKGAPHKGDPSGVRPLTPADAMYHVIRSYKPEQPSLPNDSSLEAAYRAILSGKRVLLLWDNARDAEQVERLIPHPGCVMIVTSRRHFALPGLNEKNLDRLPAGEACELLLRIAPRIGAHAGEFAQLCDYLPESLTQYSVHRLRC